jgi:triacylglycerol esterase/lipase EstA (alpha/beta hydrolase family)
MTRALFSLATATLMMIALSLPASAGRIHTDVPAQIDPAARYLIYIHGARPESFPLSEPHPTRGLFEYQNILNALAASGFEVISELRMERTNPRRFARTRVLEQVKSLIAAGVPAQNITLAGFSKGGLIAMIVASQARQPKLNIVNMAGCGKGKSRQAYDNFLANDASKLSGRMLSIYDQADKISGTCQDVSAKAPRMPFRGRSPDGRRRAWHLLYTAQGLG